MRRIILGMLLLLLLPIQVSALSSGKPTALTKTMTFSDGITSGALPCSVMGVGNGKYERWDACNGYLTLTFLSSPTIQFKQITVVVYLSDWKSYKKDTVALWLVAYDDFDGDGVQDFMIISHTSDYWGTIISRDRASSVVHFDQIGVDINNVYRIYDVSITCVCNR
jgi:hypothetical protein